jgi:hypothetical protein
MTPDQLRELMQALHLSCEDIWRMQQEAVKAASLAEDFPLSQSSKADQFKGDL